MQMQKADMWMTQWQGGGGWDQLGEQYLHTSVCRTGEGNSTPLQHSCLENPMDRGAWWAAVHGVAKSLTRLSDFTFIFHFHTLKKEMATHSSVLVWKIPGTGEPGGLPSMGCTESDTTEVAQQQQQQCVEQTANGKLLYSTGSSDRYSMMIEGWDGEMSESEGIYVHIWLIHFVVQQKVTQHRKPNILQ